MAPELVRRILDEADSGARLDRVVAAMDGVLSRVDAQRLIEEGRVRVDGEPRQKRYLVQAGQELIVEPSDAPRGIGDLIAEDLGIPILFEDEHFVIINKPAGMVTHPSAGHATGTVVNALLGHQIAGGDDPDRPGIVHRLDRDTSGLLVVARSPRAHRKLQQALRDRTIERRYRALVHGSDFPPALTINRPIGRDARVRTRMSVTSTQSREAVTHVRLLERIGPFAFVDVRLETGRTHQIRVHLESVRHPVAGDPVYGGRRGDPLHVGRQFLHAWRLAVPHPETGEVIEVECPLPDDLEAALARARMV